MQAKFIYQYKLKLIITILVDMDNGATSLPLFLYSILQRKLVHAGNLSMHNLSKQGVCIERWTGRVVSCLAMVVGDGDGEG